MPVLPTKRLRLVWSAEGARIELEWAGVRMHSAPLIYTRPSSIKRTRKRQIEKARRMKHWWQETLTPIK